VTAVHRFTKPQLAAPPIFDNLLKVLGKQTPSRPTLFKFFLNQPLYEKLAGQSAPEGSAYSTDYLLWLISAFGNAGYDYTTFHGSDIHFIKGDDHVGGFRASGGTLVHDRSTFDTCAWPDPDTCDYSALDGHGRQR